MKAHKEQRTIRRSIALSENLAKEVMSVAPDESKNNFNRVVILALKKFVDHQKREAFAQAMERMASDPTIVSECKEINNSFLRTETDGLPND